MALTGLLDNATLASVPGSPGQRLRADAAESWGRVVAALALRGVTLTLTDSYRPLATQQRIFLERYSRAYAEYLPGKVDRRVWNGTPYWRRHGQAAAAIPGTSNHGRALAVDCGVGSFTSDAYRALAAVGPARGWTNAEGRSVNEPWHWVYSPATDAHPVTNVVGSTTKPATAAPVDAPAPITPLDPYLEDPMNIKDLIESLFLVLVGRPGGAVEVAGWVIDAAETSKTPTQIVTAFWNTKAEPDSIRKAYTDILHRAGSDAEVAGWLSRALTIAQLRAEFAKSPEAR